MEMQQNIYMCVCLCSVYIYICLCSVYIYMYTHVHIKKLGLPGYIDSLLDHVSAAKPPDCCIQTDASGTWCCGGIFKQHWLQLSWPTEWSTTGIMAKELVPIVISCAIWGPLLAGHRVLCQCDNQSLVISINKGYSRDLPSNAPTQVSIVFL